MTEQSQTPHTNNSAAPDVLYQDERIIVLDKPTGLLSVPGIGPEKADCLAARVAAQWPGARIVHRLDRDTSGVIVMAFDAEAHRQLSRQFQDRETKKWYVAVVGGHLTEDEGTIDLPIRKDMDNPPRQMICHEHGRPSVTHWTALERGNGWTRVEMRPVTGRSHQLRIHMQVQGHPILGDDLYAPQHLRDAADRLMLHAWKLWLVHPETAEPMLFESDVSWMTAFARDVPMST